MRTVTSNRHSGVPSESIGKIRAESMPEDGPAAPGSEHHATEDRSGRRVVRRAIWIAPAEGITFPGAAQVFRIRRDTFDHLGNRLSKEIVHEVTSLTADQATPEAIRSGSLALDGGKQESLRFSQRNDLVR
ncbi:hypothetical protein OG978_45980 (plasmid) [Streptomyces sp. NBC_01591]|uniref:hypothetical protein n=1 Tax=Streptomyces sp. NBC_01591 TaxID=2975888 RepID=UPI002DD96AEC|nr:hypothetical protein [Streptomyces sp. NBC_01591]WSD74398.1 hypothetical protein OG978_45980 [Streptomyces sp. NBC_01591]